MTRAEATQAVLDARAARGLTWAEVADRVGRPRPWVVAALLGQHPMSAEEAGASAEALGLDEEVITALQAIPHRGGLDTTVPVDPTMYRFYEVLQVYGPTLKELINEDFGDGIMSAITFNLDFQRVDDDSGPRVVITMNGKFLPYQWD